MRILVIIVSNTMNTIFIDHIKKIKEILIDHFEKNGHIVDIASVSGKNDHSNYADVINIKHTHTNEKRQFAKLCDFLSTLDQPYDWYIKIRPDIEILEPVHIDLLVEQTAIYARARVYNGPRSIPYGGSVGGRGPWDYLHTEFKYSETEQNVVLDDQIFIFHKSAVESGIFTTLTEEEKPDFAEWFFSRICKERGAILYPISIRAILHKYRNNEKDFSVESGNINCS